MTVAHDTGRSGPTIGGLRFAVLTTRNAVFFLAILAMNYTLMRPSPVDLLFVLSFLITLFHLTLFPQFAVTKRTLTFTLIIAAWAVSFLLASMPHMGEGKVVFELVSKTFAISIGMTCAFVGMTWTRRHFERFMYFFIASAVISSCLGTIGYVLQNQLLTWDGRAKGLIDDPNMFGTFLIPAIVFCAYFLSRGQGSKLLLVGSLGVLLLGILLSFSRIALVAALGCLLVYIVFHYRKHPRRLVMIFGGMFAVGVLAAVGVSLLSPDIAARFHERLTLAQPYDLGEEGRYNRYLLVLPMIATNPIGVGVLQLEKIFPEPIHNIWLSSFVNYGWGGGISWVLLVISSTVVAIRNFRRTGSEIPVALLLSLAGVVMGASLHEGEHWRQMWICFGLIWGFNAANFVRKPTAPPPPRVKG
jgi:O-antigen ligase